MNSRTVPVEDAAGMVLTVLGASPDGDPFMTFSFMALPVIPRPS